MEFLVLAAGIGLGIAAGIAEGRKQCQNALAEHFNGHQLTIQGPNGEAVALDAAIESSMAGKVTKVNLRAATVLAAVMIGGSLLVWGIFAR